MIIYQKYKIHYIFEEYLFSLPLFKKYFLLLILLFAFISQFCPYIGLSDQNNSSTSLCTLQMASDNETFPPFSVALKTSLKPINGYTYGIIGVPVNFYAHTLNGYGVYTYHWSVNSIPVENITTYSDVSSYTWISTNTTHIGEGGFYDYVNVTVTDSLNASASATYHRTFSLKPEIFLQVSGPSETYKPFSMNITVTDCLDVSALNLSVYVNGQRIYNVTTTGWGEGFPITISYNSYKVGVYNISVVAYDGAGQNITTYHTVTIMSKDNYYWNEFRIHLKKNLQPESLIFMSIMGIFLADMAISLSKRH